MNLESDILFGLEMIEIVNLAPIEPSESIINFKFNIIDLVSSENVGHIKIRAIPLLEDDVYDMADSDSGELEKVVSTMFDDGELLDKFKKKNDTSIPIYLFYIDLVEIDNKYIETNLSKAALMAAMTHLSKRLDAEDNSIYSIPVAWMTGKTFQLNGGAGFAKSDFNFMSMDAIKTKNGLSALTTIPTDKVTFVNSYENTERFHETLSLKELVAPKFKSVKIKRM